MEPNQIITKMELITPEKARGYLNGNVMNRPVFSNIVDFYAEQMKNGFWTQSGQTISLSKDGVLIDGQHRLLAIIKSNVNIEMNVAKNVPIESFLNYDNLRSRSVNDVFYINGVTDHRHKTALIHAYNNYTRGGAGEAGFYKGEFSAGPRKSAIKLSNQQVIDFYKTHERLITEVSRFCQNCNKKLNILTTSQLGAIIMFLILNKFHDQNYVFSFFEKLHSGETSNDSILNLRNRFIQNLSKRDKYSSYTKLVFIVKLWNAYVKKISIKHFSIQQDEKTPNFI